MKRRQILATLVATAMAFALLVVAQNHPSDVAMPATTRSTGTAVATSLDVATRERWRVSVPRDVVGQPVVDEAGVIVTAGEAEVIAIDTSGAVQWKAAIAGARVNAPRINGDRVFVAGKRGLTALDRATGAVVWTVATAHGAEPDDRVNRPTVADNVVIATTSSGRVLGINRDTGALRWNTTVPTASTSEPAAINGVVAVVGIGGWTAFDAATGTELWSGDIGIIGTSSPVAYQSDDEPRFAVATDERLVSVAARTGAIRWVAEAEQSEFFQVPVATAEGELLVPDHWGRLRAYDAASGERRWSTAGGDAIAEFGEPAVVGDRFVALPLDADGPRLATPDGAVALRPPATGHGVARLSTGELVVTTWGPATNYVLAYDLDLGGRGRTR